MSFFKELALINQRLTLRTGEPGGTAANVSDVVMAGDLLHGEEHMVFADAGYTGVANRPENAERAVKWHVARASEATLEKLPEGEIKALTQYIEKIKASVRARVEHSFHVVKNLFGHRKTRYRGIAKNESQWQILFALANVYMTRRKIMLRGFA